MTCKTSPKKITCQCGRKIRGNAYYLHARKCPSNPLFGTISHRSNRKQNRPQGLNRTDWGQGYGNSDAPAPVKSNESRKT